MELSTLWVIFKRRWWLIGLPVVVTGLLTLSSWGQLVRPPVRYEVQVRLTAAAPPGATIEDLEAPYEDAAYVPWLASEYVAVNLPHWIVSDSFAAEVHEQLSAEGMEVSLDDLKGAFRADSYRSIVTLFVGWDDPNTIVPIAEAAITVLQTRNQRYFPQFAVEPARVVPLDDIEVGEVPPPLLGRVSPLIRLFLGGLAGLGLAALAEHFDRSLYTATDAEALGLEVLAVIPRE